MSNFLFEAAGIADVNSYPPANVPLPDGDYIERRIPRRVGSVTITNLGSILYWCLTGQLLPYENNRGNGRPSKKTMDSAYAGVKGDSLGECTIGSTEIDGENQMIMSDFHSRCAGFLKRYVDHQMSARELRTPISVRVVTNHLESYQGLNSGEPHRSKDKIQNPDLAYGPIIESIENAVGAECMSFIGENKWTVLSSIIYNLCLNDTPDWTWSVVYQKRMKAMKVANNAAGFFKLSRDKQRRLNEAIKHWYDTMTSLNKETSRNGATQPKAVSDILKNAGLFGFIVCDQMWPTAHFSTMKVLVKRIIREMDTVQRACPELCRGNRNTIISWSNRLSGLFSRRQQQSNDTDADTDDVDDIAAA